MTDQIGSVLPFSPARISTGVEISATDHLADARLHLQRCLLAIKAAAESNPALLTRLGTPHCLLQDLMADLERVR